MYCLVLGFGNTSPLDSTIYYGGNLANQLYTTLYDKLYIPKGGTITKCNLNIFTAGADPTAEDVAHVLRKNATTDYAIMTTDWDNTTVVTKRVYNSDMSIPVAEGDYITLKITTPAWATNPTNVRGFGSILIQC